MTLEALFGILEGYILVFIALVMFGILIYYYLVEPKAPS